MRNTPSLAEVLLGAMENRLESVYTAMPAEVVSYSATTQKVSVKPLIKQTYENENGEQVTESMPIITNVPVVFPGAGDFRITFPIAAGDTVLIVFSHSSLDKWLAVGGEVNPDDTRKHSLSDAIAIPGLRSFKSPSSGVSSTDMELVAADGAEIHAGGSSALALAANLEQLRSTIAGAGSGNAIPAAVGALGPYTGTSILKGG